MEQVLDKQISVNTICVVPCQLRKKPNCPCSLICAFENGCPVYYSDEHDNPIVQKDSYI